MQTFKLSKAASCVITIYFLKLFNFSDQKKCRTKWDMKMKILTMSTSCSRCRNCQDHRDRRECKYSVFSKLNLSISVSIPNIVNVSCLYQSCSLTGKTEVKLLSVIIIFREHRTIYERWLHENDIPPFTEEEMDNELDTLTVSSFSFYKINDSIWVSGHSSLRRQRLPQIPAHLSESLLCKDWKAGKLPLFAIIIYLFIFKNNLRIIF